jgi:hypothetical protein
MVGRALVGEMRLGRQRIVDGEPGLVGKQPTQAARRLRPSRLRCRLVSRLAGVKCTRPSAVSALGVTVAALAAHIGEAEQAAAARAGASFQAFSRTRASEPEKPIDRSSARSGRSCGGSTNCGTPQSASLRILVSPSSTAARGLETSPALTWLAMLPGDRPTYEWVGPTRPSQLASTAREVIRADP